MENRKTGALFSTTINFKKCKEVNKMRKTFKHIFIILIICLLSFLIYWISALIRCEYLTLSYGYQFEEAYKQNVMIENVVKYKVLEYSDNHARVYYVSGDPDSNILYYGNVLRFDRENGKWKFNGLWSTVWSKSGSADGFIWPYGR